MEVIIYLHIIYNAFKPDGELSQCWLTFHWGQSKSRTECARTEGREVYYNKCLAMLKYSQFLFVDFMVSSKHLEAHISQRPTNASTAKSNSEKGHVMNS